MRIGLRVPDLPAGGSLESVLAAAARAGSAAVDLPISADGLLTFASAVEDCVQFAKTVSAAGRSIAAITVSSGAEVHFASPNSEFRRLAQEHTRAAIERAAWLDAPTVVLAPAMVSGPAAPKPGTRYEEAYWRALEALRELCFDAAQRGIRLACLNCTGRFLLTPMEAREFIDRVNSAWVGMCLDVAATSSVGCPADWIQSLGGRLFHVRLGGDDEAAVIAALDGVRYTGAAVRNRER